MTTRLVKIIERVTQTTARLVKIFERVDTDGWMYLRLISWEAIAVRAERIGYHSERMDRAGPIHV